jgi:chromosome segregation ATPase
MIKLLKFAFTGLVLFGGAGAASWFWMHQQQSAAKEDEVADASMDKSPNDKEQSGTSMPLSNVPVPVRPTNASAEEITRFALGLRKQQEALQKREEAFEKERAQLNLVQADLRNQQRELEGLLAQIRESLISGDEVMKKLALESQQLDQKRSESNQQLEQINKANSQQKNAQRANSKTTIDIFTALSTDDAAAHVRQLIDSNRLDTAVRMLASVKGKEAAEILTAIGDQVLVAQLMDGIENMKQPEPPAKKRR